MSLDIIFHVQAKHYVPITINIMPYHLPTISLDINGEAGVVMLETDGEVASLAIKLFLP